MFHPETAPGQPVRPLDPRLQQPRIADRARHHAGKHRRLEVIPRHVEPHANPQPPRHHIGRRKQQPRLDADIDRPAQRRAGVQQMQQTEHRARNQNRHPAAKHRLHRAMQNAAEQQFLEHPRFHRHRQIGQQEQQRVHPLHLIDAQHHQDRRAGGVKPRPAQRAKGPFPRKAGRRKLGHRAALDQATIGDVKPDRRQRQDDLDRKAGQRRLVIGLQPGLRPAHEIEHGIAQHEQARQRRLQHAQPKRPMGCGNSRFCHVRPFSWRIRGVQGSLRPPARFLIPQHSPVPRGRPRRPLPRTHWPRGTRHIAPAMAEGALAHTASG